MARRRKYWTKKGRIYFATPAEHRRRPKSKRGMSLKAYRRFKGISGRRWRRLQVRKKIMRQWKARGGFQ